MARPSAYQLNKSYELYRWVKRRSFLLGDRAAIEGKKMLYPSFCGMCFLRHVAEQEGDNF
jgi:hypothetical protein